MSQPKSKRGALRQYDAILRGYRRTYAGGGMFGFDWPTLRINAPEAYARILVLREVYPKLPD